MYCALKPYHTFIIFKFLGIEKPSHLAKWQHSSFQSLGKADVMATATTLEIESGLEPVKES